MTQFNPDHKTTLTFGETLLPAMSITEQADADQYLADYVAYLETELTKTPRTDLTAEQIAKANLGYYAGYFDDATRTRVERLFQCAHPVFGAFEDNGDPSPEAAFALGFAKGSQQHD